MHRRHSCRALCRDQTLRVDRWTTPLADILPTSLLKRPDKFFLCLCRTNLGTMLSPGLDLSTHYGPPDVKDRREGDGTSWTPGCRERADFHWIPLAE